MDCKTTSTNRQRGFTLSETMVVTGFTSLVLIMLAVLFIFTSRSCTAIANYFDLDRYSRIALDRMTQELRQARGVSSFSGTQVTFLNGSGASVQYIYEPEARTLNRVTSASKETLLVDCNWLKFDVFQRNPMNGTYETYYAAKTPGEGKLVQVSWGCSREILGAKLNTEIVQSSKIVIRKSQT